MSLCRSLLYVPGNRPDLLAKLPRFEADGYIFDLATGVPPDQKERAREVLAGLAKSHVAGGHAIHVRVNPVHSPWHRDDLEAALSMGTTRLHIPGIVTAEDLRDVERRVHELASRWSVPLDDFEVYPAIESSRAILAMDEIANVTGRTHGLVLNGDELVSEWGAPRSRDGYELELARRRLVVTANAHGLLPIDGTYPFHKDLEGCESDARHARGLGFRGKLAIHPSQCPVFNEVFRPTASDITQAGKVMQRIVTDRADHSGTSAHADSQRVTPRERNARRILDWAKSIGDL